jgi:hypothetical protein
MRETTYRQYLVWMAWLDDQWNHPSREDTYLMQIACEVRRVLSKNPNQVKVGDFKLEFTSAKPAKTNTEGGSKGTQPLSMEDRVEGSKALWMAAVGSEIRRAKIGDDGQLVLEETGPPSPKPPTRRPLKPAR